MTDRINKLVNLINDNALDAVLVSSKYNRRYLSGFTGSSGFLFITKDAKYMLTDFRYIEQATSQCVGYEVIDFYDKGLVKTINDLVLETETKLLGFENKQMTVSDFENFTEKVTACEWKPMNDMVEKIRMIKDSEEVALIKKASAIGDAAFSHILEYIKVGMTEIEVAIELEYFMKKQGASKLSFDSIVASGKRSSLPHAVPTDKVIEEGDFVTLDFGCIYQGYCSDMTRTFVMGKASDKQKEIYNTVLKAQLNALDKIKGGVIGKVADAYSRDIINDAGYRKNFGHGLGHSLGLEVHESPRFSLLAEDIILPGMIMSVEPGIYIPDFGGVRIEDLVHITEDGAEILVSSPKELIEL